MNPHAVINRQIASEALLRSGGAGGTANRALALAEATANLLFGDGSDGTFVCLAGNTTLFTKDFFLDTLIVPATAILVTNGFRIYCRTLLQNDGIIQVNGNDAVGSVEGASTNINGTLGFGSEGGFGGGANGGPGTDQTGATGFGGVGGQGGAGLAGVGGTGGANPVVDKAGNVRGIPQILTGVLEAFGATAPTAVMGGSGGGGGGGDGVHDGGGGGGGGGVMLLAAQTLVNNGVITSNGGIGGNGQGGNSGGGGGGAGGVILVTSINRSGVGTFEALPGLGGLRSGTGVDGANGGSGLIVFLE